MMRSLYSGVSGLRNHQTRMDVIGNNIANVNTTAFKTSRTVFQDIYSQTVKSASTSTDSLGGTNPSQIGLGVRLSTIDTMFTSGATQITDNPSDLAIEGDGLFVVDTNGTDVGGLAYTRAGNFYIDNAGYLVTADGYFVMGYNLASPTTSKVQALDDEGDPAWQTNIVPTTTEYYVLDDADGTLISKEVYDAAAPGTYTLKQATDSAGNLLWQTATDSNDVLCYVVDDGAGGTTLVPVTDYNDDPTLYGDRLPLPATESTTTNQTFYVLSDSSEVLVSDYDPEIHAARTEIWEQVQSVDTEGNLVWETAMNTNGVECYVIDDGNDPPTLVPVATWDEDTDGPRTPVMEDKIIDTYDRLELAENLRESDMGYINLADFVNISFDSTGTIWGIDKNEQKVAVAQVAMAMFTNNTGLEKVGGSLYHYTANSGEPVYTVSGKHGSGKINPGGLEMSNVDLAAEFTDMIITQRGFQANSRIITTSDSMLEELVNLKR